MSIAGGLWRALERGRALECGAVQIFLKNQRQWASRPLSTEDVREFAAARRRTRIEQVFAHASYLINLATPDRRQWAQAIDAFTDELERAEGLGLSCVVIHAGSHLGRGVAWGLARVTAALDEVTRRTAGARVRIALENTAGAGGTLGRQVAELGAMIQRATRPERLGVCLDTCHLFAAGYDIRQAEAWTRVLAECEQAFGLERILAFHLNDAASALGSGLDRHQHIGQGALGLAPFRRLLNDPRLHGVPKVLETPKEPEPLADRRNLRRLLALRRRPPRRPAPSAAGAPQREAVTPTRRQSARTGQREQRGDSGVQTF
jgi:deoxyribonuclease-4